MTPWARRSSALLSLLLHLSGLALWQSGASTSAEPLGPWQHFKTEPTFEAAVLNVTQRTENLHQLSPEYLFFSLTTFSDGGPWGPQIHDSNGDLVFFNNLNEHTLAVGDPHVCDYKGHAANHFCAGELIGGVRGRWTAEQTVYDNTFKQLARFPKAGNLGDSDGHENNMLPGGMTFLRLVYNPRQVDLTPYAGSKEGYVHDVCFQEIDVRTSKELFQWCYLDRGYPISDTYIYMNVPENQDNNTSGIAGKGTKDDPWDFLHLNAVDKNDEGDYLVSARHLDQIFKIAGPDNAHGMEPGTTIWRLGGKASDFKVIGGDNVMFSKQHHVRYVSTGVAETVITLFDNAWEGANDPTADYSAGKFIFINNETMEAHQIQEFPHPYNKHAMAQGSMVPLQNGNVFVGWGWLPEFTEYSSTGEVLIHAELTHDTKDPHLSAYRSYKFPWKAYPHWKPKLLAYQPSCQRTELEPLVVYASWNGATEVMYWRFWVTDDSSLRRDNWIKAGTFPKKGFETQVELRPEKASGFISHVLVEGLDSSKRVLGTRSIRTFVPSAKLTARKGVKCGKKSCRRPQRFEYPPSDNGADMCRASDVPAFFALLIVFIVLEGIGYWWSYPLDLIFMRRRGLHLEPEKLQAILHLAEDPNKRT